MLIGRIAFFYIEGFRQMTLGRLLWCVILLKLALIFAFLRVFFFPPFLHGSSAEQEGVVSHELTGRAAPQP